MHTDQLIPFSEVTPQQDPRCHDKEPENPEQIAIRGSFVDIALLDPVDGDPIEYFDAQTTRGSKSNHIYGIASPGQGACILDNSAVRLVK
jgi:hypothetical protein